MSEGFVLWVRNWDEKFGFFKVCGFLGMIGVARFCFFLFLDVELLEVGERGDGELIVFFF